MGTVAGKRAWGSPAPREEAKQTELHLERSDVAYQARVEQVCQERDAEEKEMA